MYEGYLPISKQDMQERGIKQLDFVYVCGDAYVDHPSFGHAIIARLLEAHGYTVGIIAQPDWKDDASISVLGVPRLGFLVSAGNMDSMVNHYSVSKKRRATDSYTPGGVMGKRPDYATVVYCNLIRHTYKKTPIIIGGIEASLRRLAHYDYWSNKVKRSILLDSGADLISYGMGEHSIIEIADALNAGIDVHDITFIDGTVFKTKNRDLIYDAIELPDYDEIKENKRSFAQSFYKQYCNTDPFSGKRLFEPYGGTTFVVQNPPAKPLTQTEMDEVYALPYMRNYHPSYEKDGGVPAIREIKFSLISNRGCFGGCSFCALTFHQGRIIQTRSHESIIDEAKQIIQEPDFKGYIHDVGGPTANFRAPACKKQMTKGAFIMAVKTTTDQTFEQDTQQGVVLIDFWATWCGPCRMQSPVVDALSEQMPDVAFYKMDVDENPATPQQFRIMSIPTLMIKKDGQVVDQLIGYHSTDQLKQVLNQYL